MEALLFFHGQAWQHRHEGFGEQPATDERHSTASMYAHTVQPATRRVRFKDVAIEMGTDPYPRRRPRRHPVGPIRATPYA
jgi:hypothetical protein